MEKTLILFAHPALEKSKVNLTLKEGVEELENITICDLYENYPDFHIDVGHEQELLKQHDHIVWHHPFYWYSVPALLKQWFDLVLEYGWAYGKGGDALSGKKVTSVISTGGAEEAYSVDGKMLTPLKNFLGPLKEPPPCASWIIRNLSFFTEP